MDDIRNSLNNAIETEFANIATLPATGDEKKKAIADLEVLYKLRIEEIKAENAHLEHLDRHELERDRHFLETQTQDDERRLKEAQHKSQNLFQWISISVSVIGTAASLISGHVIHRRGLRFEENGSVTSSHNRNFFSRILPK